MLTSYLSTRPYLLTALILIGCWGAGIADTVLP